MPRGHSDGGQWTDDPAWGGGEAYRRRRRNQSNDFAEPVGYARTIADLPPDAQVQPSQSTRRRTRLAQAEMGSPYAIGDLHQHEGRGGAHTIRDHVGKSDTYLINRLRMPDLLIRGNFYYLPGASTFRNVKEATGFINKTLSDPINRAKVESVVSGEEFEATLFGDFKRKVGHGFVVSDAVPGRRYDPLNRPRNIERADMYKVKVVIRRDPSLPTGFRVQTAHPIWSRNR